MGFHSDDERGVQATIASLSLGSPAQMSFRPRLEGKRAKPCLMIVLRHVSWPIQSFSHTHYS